MKTTLTILVLGMTVALGGFPSWSGTSATKPDGTAYEKPKMKPSALKANMKFGIALKNRDLEGEATDFMVARGSSLNVYCWSEILDVKASTAVKHVWYLGGNKIHSEPLEVKNNKARVWSFVTFDENKLGEGRVDILDTKGRLVAAKEFKVFLGEEQHPFLSRVDR